MLKINDLKVSIEGKEILKGIDIEVNPGELVVIFGPNGSGKTTLLKAIMGIGGVRIGKGKIEYKEKVINTMSVDERAKLGIGLMFQKPPRINGVVLREVVNFLGGSFADLMKYKLERMADRNLNDNLSGGELKRSELMQLKMQKADLILLDEPDSGVDVENVKLIGKEINKMLTDSKKKSAILITHTGHILDYVKSKKSYVIMDGKVICHGETKKMLKIINANGYKACIACSKRYAKNC